jgi:hypothetical protein
MCVIFRPVACEKSAVAMWPNDAVPADPYSTPAGCDLA